MLVGTETTQNRRDYSRELHRLATFQDWCSVVTNNVRPSTLARLGFYYTGQDDSVVCYRCQSEIKGSTTGDEVRRKHDMCWQQYNWDNEVPSVISAVRQRLPNRFSGRTGSLSPTTVTSNNRDVLDHSSSSTSNVATATITRSNAPFYELCDKIFCRADRKDFSNIYNNTSVFAAVPVPADIGLIIDRTQPDFERLTAESARLATFHDWPERAAAIVEPRELARAGMFYTGQADRVQCAFCRGYLQNWVQGDRPAEEHRRHFPECCFVKNTNVGTFDVVDNSRVTNQV